jgi:hypothetical protein
MTTAYSADELKAIVNGAMMVGMGVAMADMGVVSTAIEATAMSKEMIGAAAKYPGNSIIQAAFSTEAMRSGSLKVDKPEVKAEDIVSGAFIDKAIAAVNSAVATMEGKATAAEIQEYKSFVYGVGQAVAEAAGSGLFGRGDVKVSDSEAAALTKIKAAMGV